jgi:hypothetical protein
VRASLCEDARYRNSEKSRGESGRCKKSLSEYRQKYFESQKMADEIEDTEKKLEQAKQDILQAAKDAKENGTNGFGGGGAGGNFAGRGATEGGVCMECMAKGNGYFTQQPNNQTNWASVAANVGTGIAAMYAGYQQNKMVAQYNSNAGWPTQSYPTWSYGLPYMAQGLYGALGGSTGQGTFGCGTSAGSVGGMTGGAFGYPQSMYGGTGGYSTGMINNYPMMSMYGSMNMYGNSTNSYPYSQWMNYSSYLQRSPYSTASATNPYIPIPALSASTYGTSTTTNPYIPIPAYGTSTYGSNYGVYNNGSYNNGTYYNGGAVIPAASTYYYNR